MLNCSNNLKSEVQRNFVESVYCFLFLLLFVAQLRMAILASIQSSKSSETHKPHQPKATGNVGWMTQQSFFPTYQVRVVRF